MALGSEMVDHHGGAFAALEDGEGRARGAEESDGEVGECAAPVAGGGAGYDLEGWAGE